MLITNDKTKFFLSFNQSLLDVFLWPSLAGHECHRLHFLLLPVHHISPVVHIFQKLFITRNIAGVNRALPATEQNTS